MTLTEQFLSELDREGERSRKMLREIPDGKHDWKPHEKSMAFGYLASLVATMPSWFAMMVKIDRLDVAPVGGSNFKPEPMTTSADYLKGLDKALGDARVALAGTTDEHLMTNWQLLAAGQVVQEGTRREMLRDTFNHWAHHRGQMTVYLRLLGAKVPALYGPSADDKSF